MSEVVVRMCSPKKIYPKIFGKSHVTEFLSNNAAILQVVRLALFLKRDPGTGLLEAASRRCSTK